jgi:Raf kinase inhibitor-like YbhB/YbcL family protein
MRRMKRLVMVFLVGCGGGDSAGIDATGPDDTLPNPDGLEPDAPETGFAITSPAFMEGQAIPVVHACDGANTSPQLEWGTFDGALSYSLVFTDLSNNLIHWVIYDIPASATGLPADVDKVFEPPDVAGAKQTVSFAGGVRGYLGPCPPNEHTYEYKVYALDVATLPGTSMATNRAQAETLILQHDLGSAALSGTYERP